MLYAIILLFLTARLVESILLSSAFSKSVRVHDTQSTTFLGLADVKNSILEFGSLSTLAEGKISNHIDSEKSKEVETGGVKNSFTAYIYNLPKKIQKKQLYELFCKSGNVSKVVMPIDRTTGLPRGFAFVSMSTLLELERIIALSNKIEASGHKILVKIAKARRQTAEEEKSNLVKSLFASAKVGDTDRVKAILETMTYQFTHEGKPWMKPKTKLYNAYINAWATSGQKDSALKAEEILRMMTDSSIKGDIDLNPDKISFTSVIHAYAKCGAGERAEELLRLMEKMHKQGNKDVKPDSTTYNAVINAWAKSNERGAAVRAEDLLKEMYAMFENGDKDVSPCSVSFNSVLNALSKSNEKGSAKKAENILQWMEHHSKRTNKNAKPNIISYNTVINALSNAGEKNSGQRAEKILQKMEILHKNNDNDVVPDTKIYNNVIKILARSNEKGSAKRAENLLRKMFYLSKYEYSNINPNTISFTTVINAWMKSDEKGALLKAKKVSQMMEKYRRNQIIKRNRS